MIENPRITLLVIKTRTCLNIISSTEICFYKIKMNYEKHTLPENTLAFPLAFLQH
jgi:hypothetical protein